MSALCGRLIYYSFLTPMPKMQWSRAASRTAAIFENQAEIFEDVKRIREADSQLQPSKLLMVYRDKRLSGSRYWEKRIISEFGLRDKMYEAVVVKNTASVCKKLQIVKHLIRVKPVTFPQGVPQEGDCTGTLLKQDGQFVWSPMLQSVNAEQLQEDPQRLRVSLDDKTVCIHLRRSWHT